MSARQISTPSQSEAELQIRQLVRQTSRDGLGVFISGILATHLPWLLIPAVYNVYGFLTNLSLLRSLQKLFRRKGIPVRKRVIAKGIIEGVQTKLLSSVLTIGHGEFIDGTGAVLCQIRETETIFRFGDGNLTPANAALMIFVHICTSLPSTN
ncbi:hypothetical protein F5X68DRAFT_264665 [Plectosphaerella plurivora]|uniref:Uncharacterized protein n=1 Tax=Plectosphaerella plurivora TaxID=936078 RepID=A0A9P9A6Y4_9PEZI|nr:hypothetical protein F5X68DRAFT_264665 [Plectosphaerella plurivora]